MRYVIAIYEIDRRYGGPEEGGWWYDTGELRRILGVRHNENEAYTLARRLNGWLARLQAGHRDVSSVLYSGGRYAIEVHEEYAPRYYPEERPYYS